MNKHDIAQRVLDLVGDRAEAEVRVSGGTASLTRFANSFIHQNVGEEGESVALKVVVDGRVSTAITNRMDTLDKVVDDVIEAARHQPVDEDWPGLAAPTEAPESLHYDEATAGASPQERAAVVSDFVAQGPDMRGAGYCDTSATEVVMANSAGLRMEGRATSATVDGIHQTDTSAGSGHATAYRLADLDGSAVGALAASRAKRSSEPYDTKPGEYEVVLSPEAVSTIAVFLAVYGFNAKMKIDGQSFMKIGEQQLDESVNIWDDYFDPKTLGLPFDAEGTPKRRVDHVEAGVSRSHAHDRRTAAKMGAASTGHALPGGAGWGAMPTNLFVGGGDQSEEELIASVDRGLYVSTFNYCRILDPKSQVVTGLTRNGTFMIENGAITGAVTNLRFTQSFVQALGAGNVLGIGNDSRLADSEFGPGMIVAPSMRLAAWHFTGGAEG